MKILYHHRTLGDGAEAVHINEMIDAWRRLGHEVRVNALVSAAPSPAGRGRGRLVERIRRALPEFMYELAQLALSAASAASFARALAEYQPDFVYKRHARYDFGPVWAARRCGIPIILEVNCVYSSPILRQFEPIRFPRLLTSVERWIFRRSTRNIAVSKPLADELLTAARGEAQVTVMPNGVNHDRFRPGGAGAEVRRSLGLGQRQVIGFVGTLWRWHGLELLIEALTLLKTPDVHLLIVGDGESRQDLAARVTALGLADRVTFVGRVPHGEVASYVGAMDVAVLPAESRAHASPMKILEYMAMARPVVAPRLASIQELITEGIEGLLFTPGDPRALAECIDRLLASPAECQAIGARGRLRVESDRNWDRNAQDVIALYASVQRDSVARAVSPQTS